MEQERMRGGWEGTEQNEGRGELSASPMSVNVLLFDKQI